MCLKNDGTFRAVKIYTNPINYYTAGFECCRAKKGLKPMPTPRPRPIKPLHVWNSKNCRWFDETMKTPMGKIPVDVDGKREKMCLRNKGTFRAVKIYTNPMNYYTAGFECCRAKKGLKPMPAPRPRPTPRPRPEPKKKGNGRKAYDMFDVLDTNRNGRLSKFEIFGLFNEADQN